MQITRKRTLGTLAATSLIAGAARATDHGAFRNRNEVVGIALPLNQR